MPFYSPNCYLGLSQPHFPQSLPSQLRVQRWGAPIRFPESFSAAIALSQFSAPFAKPHAAVNRCAWVSLWDEQQLLRDDPSRGKRSRHQRHKTRSYKLSGRGSHGYCAYRLKGVHQCTLTFQLPGPAESAHNFPRGGQHLSAPTTPAAPPPNTTSQAALRAGVARCPLKDSSGKGSDLQFVKHCRREPRLCQFLSMEL